MFNVCIGDQPDFDRRTAVVADGDAGEVHDLDLMFYKTEVEGINPWHWSSGWTMKTRICWANSRNIQPHARPHGIASWILHGSSGRGSHGGAKCILDIDAIQSSASKAYGETRTRQWGGWKRSSAAGEGVALAKRRQTFTVVCWLCRTASVRRVTC
jgi:hypothetical protein